MRHMIPISFNSILADHDPPLAFEASFQMQTIARLNGGVGHGVGLNGGGGNGVGLNVAMAMVLRVLTMMLG
ncbi:uncharacterized protein G2W53_032549 [Senna tora]|uniref:Uncharacterized protein n=1 Tax=Senna tora TaxID=362788 RepID=A0A834SXR5_9FABA|nr:uncharacterized protein G2W53_032549 [Senna tora]